MFSPFISVIIPTYNRSYCVAEAIDSAAGQSYKNHEIIVVDDGSTDDTAPVLDRYDGRLTALRTQHAGPSAARNAGIRAARGDYIAFLDSDDLWKPRKLEQQIGFFAKTPDACICQTQEIWIRNGVRVNPMKKHKKYSGWIFRQCLPLCIVSPSAVMLHRSIFDRVGLFDETLPACEDYDLWLRIAPHYPIYLIDKPLVIKRGGHDDQQSRTVPTLDRLRIHALCKSLASGSLNEAQYGLALAELEKKCAVYGAGCIKRGKTDEGKACLGLPEKYASSLKFVGNKK
jgi:glycosyltransferase involved in cell wall biosynthesis